MRKFNFIDPGAIMGVVVALIILAVGVFAFFVTITEITKLGDDNYYEDEYNEALDDVTDTGNSILNIVGIVLIMGAIMAIVGVVYNFIAPSPSTKHTISIPHKDKEIEEALKDEPDLPNVSLPKETFSDKEDFKKKKEDEQIDDYRLIGMYTSDQSEAKIENLKDTGYWVKTKHTSGKDGKNIAIYASKWTKYEKEVRGRPKWRR